MKIAVIRQRYVARGGAERYLSAVIRELARRNHEVHVIARAWESLPAEGVHFHRVPMIRLTAFVSVLTFAWGARRVAARADCDLVFSLERTLAQDVYRAGDGCHREWLLQRRRHVSAVKRFSLAVNPFHRAMLSLERRTFSPQCTGRIIANSQRGKEEVVRHYGFPAERIHVVHNGVDVERFRPPALPRTGNSIQLLFVGSGFERKGLQFCIQALSRLPPHVHLKVAGKGNFARYRRLAARHGVEGRVEFLGTSLDTAKVYPAADLLVHPAIYEPFANVCLEALACGVPVVTSRINGASEVLEPGRNGAIVEDPADIDELVKAITPFLDRQKLVAAAAAARQTAEANPFALNISRTLEVLQLARAGKGQSA